MYKLEPSKHGEICLAGTGEMPLAGEGRHACSHACSHALGASVCCNLCNDLLAALASWLVELSKIYLSLVCHHYPC